MMKFLILFAAVALVAGEGSPKQKRGLYLLESSALPYYNAPAVVYATPAFSAHDAAIAPTRSIAFSAQAPAVAYAAPAAAAPAIAYAAPAIAAPAVSYAAPAATIAPGHAFVYAAPAVAAPSLPTAAPTTADAIKPIRAIAYPDDASSAYDGGK